MKAGLIVYSSNTGNTKKVAECMQQTMPEYFDIADIKENPDITEYSVIAMGYWVDKGAPNKGCINFMKKISHKKVILFQTVGSEPLGYHALRCAANGGTYLGEGCQVIGVYSCQGELSPQVIEVMKRMPAGAPHAVSKENLQRWAASKGHPNESDLEGAAEFITHTISMYERFRNGYRR